MKWSWSSAMTVRASSDSIDADTRFFHDPGELRELRLEIRAKLLRRARRHLGALVRKALRDIGQPEDVEYVRADLADDVLRHTCGRDQPVPDHDLYARVTAFDQRR